MDYEQSGTVTELEVIQKDGSQWILDNDGEDIIMNVSDAEESIQEGDFVRVFLYINRRKNAAATMHIPDVTSESYGWARVIRIDEKEGVYVDIGASMEVLVNRADMPKVRALWPKPGDALYMTLRTDLGGGLFGRLATEEKVMEHLIEAPTSLFNKNLRARAYRLLPVGSFMLTVPEKYRIFVHNTEMEQEPRLGQEMEVRVIGVRDDGTLNGSLLPRKEERLSDDAETVLRYLNSVGGRMPFTDKSTPDEIQEMFSMSKASFKRALGKLMKERRVIQNDGWTSLK